VPYFNKSIKILHEQFSREKMIWGHGHFKPHEIYYSPQKDNYYLIDFGHTTMYPESYELSYIVWSDWLMSADWNLPYKKWRKGVYGWIKQFKQKEKELKMKNIETAVRAGLIEMTIRAILIDVAYVSKNKKEVTKRLSLLYKLLNELIKSFG